MNNFKFKLPIAPALAPAEGDPIVGAPKVDASKFSELAQRELPKAATRTRYVCSCGKTSWDPLGVCSAVRQEEVPDDGGQ
jgi:hypothetical protein